MQYGNQAATAFKALPALDKMGNSLFWQQAGLNATAQGALGALQGGSFQDSFMASATSSVGSNFNAAVGDWADKNGFTGGDFSKVLLHAGIGAAQAGLTKQNVAAGAIGAATAELLSPLNDSLQTETGNKLAGELLTVGGAMVANQLLNPDAGFTSNLTAANQALQTDRNNRQMHWKGFLAAKDQCKSAPSSSECRTIERIGGVRSQVVDFLALPESNVAANFGVDGKVVSYTILDKQTNQPTMIMEPAEFEAYREAPLATRGWFQLAPQWSLDQGSAFTYLTIGNTDGAKEHLGYVYTSPEFWMGWRRGQRVVLCWDGRWGRLRAGWE